MDERRLPVDSFATRMGGLKNLQAVMETFYKNPEAMEELVVDGVNELVDVFDRIKTGDPILKIMPGTDELKSLLGEVQLPKVGKLPVKSVVRGFKEARTLMLAGQESKEKVNILIASEETGPEAIFVGSSIHFLERTYFDLFRQRGVEGIGEPWKKDQVIAALVECMLLIKMEAEMAGDEREPRLFKLITTPIEEGGIGWKKQNRVSEFREKYLKYKNDE